MVIKRIGPLSLGKVAGVLYGALGLVVGAIVSVAAVVGGFNAESAFGPLAGGLAGVAALALLPIFYGGLGFIAAVIGAWLYNVAARVAGGIEIDVQ